ncbi:MAG: OmpA family protein [Bacteroides sp.]|nr:OmpA family protein [Roseburia sp.]MCM1347339.1 OmpA family protein [Bacteroides sp.]MCM1421833.1 OmpA family protein [Bacteroides sp.]
MEKTRKLKYDVIFCLCACFFAACSNENIPFKKGEQSYAIGEYYQAAAYYKKSYTRTSPKDRDKRAVRAYKMGDCYRRINYAQKAVAAYQNAVRYNCPDSTALFYLAQQQLKIGNYKAAMQNFKLYLEKDPGNELARSGLLSCELAPQWKANPNLYKIKKEAVFNSRRTDYSPMLVGDDADQLVFSSTRNDANGDELSGITGVKYGDLFFSRKDENGKWKQPEVIESDVNTEYDEGASCISPDGKTMYFTRCSSDPDYPRYAEIWESARSDASWGAPKKCEISKDTLSSYAHPAISPDGKWMYFVSDMPGGIGGLDIWRVRLFDSGFGGVENLGRPINTPGDEMFPSFRPNGDLYFSSDGHPGMGGLDILKAVPDSARGWIVENQQFPLNSSGDDFGMTFEGLHNRGFFCSNRNDGKGWEHIFSFELPEVLQTVTGWVYEKDGYELPEGLVYMVGNDGTNEKLSVKGDGSFTKVLKPGVEYVFLGTCKGYLNVKQELTVAPSEHSEEYTLQFPLPPINVPVLIDNIFYEFDKADLTPESTDALDKLVVMMTENPNITIELGAHCDYRGNDAYNERLSQRRAESVVNYLIDHGIKKERLTAMGYGESRPKVIRKKLTETYKFLNENDTLTENYIKARPEEEQEICNALNRRTEFKVLRTTYGTTLQEYNLEEEERKARKKEENEEEEYFDF